MARTKRKEKSNEGPGLLALDLAFAKLGWVVFKKSIPVACGVIVTEKSHKKLGVRVADDEVRRCQEQAHALHTICVSYDIKGILAELPSGAQDANAAKAFGLCKGMLGAFLETQDIPAEFFTPNEVKKALFGKGKASKEDMMLSAVKVFGGRREVRPHGKKTRDVYHFIDGEYGVGAFEHIADSCGVYCAARHGNLVKLFG